MRAALKRIEDENLKLRLELSDLRHQLSLFQRHDMILPVAKTEGKPCCQSWIEKVEVLSNHYFTSLTSMKKELETLKLEASRKCHESLRSAHTELLMLLQQKLKTLKAPS